MSEMAEDGALTRWSIRNTAGATDDQIEATERWIEAYSSAAQPEPAADEEGS